MKSGVQEIVGRRIAGVIVKEAIERPQSQVFLLFDDGTYYEFYGYEPILGTGGVDRGGCAEVLASVGPPRHDVIRAALADSTAQKTADRELALSGIRAQLRRPEVHLGLLQSSLRRAEDAGFDWRLLYAEAQCVREKSWPAAPGPETLSTAHG